MRSNETPTPDPEMAPGDNIATQRKQYEQKCLEAVKEQVIKELPRLREMVEEGQEELLRKIDTLKVKEGAEDEVRKLNDEFDRRAGLLKPENAEAFQTWQVKVYTKQFLICRNAALLYVWTLQDIWKQGRGRRPEISEDMRIDADIDTQFSIGIPAKINLRYGAPNWEHVKLHAQPKFLNEEVFQGNIYNGDVFFHMTPNGADTLDREGVVPYAEWENIIEGIFQENGFDFRRQDRILSDGPARLGN